MFEGNESSKSTLNTGQAYPKNGKNQAVESAPAVEEKKGISGLLKNPLVIGALIILVAAGLYWGIKSWQLGQSRVYIENSEISAPVISIGSAVPGILQEVYVQAGKSVSAGQPLFNVDGRIIPAKTSGVVTSSPKCSRSDGDRSVVGHLQRAGHAVGHVLQRLDAHALSRHHQLRGQHPVTGGQRQLAGQRRRRHLQPQQRLAGPGELHQAPLEPRLVQRARLLGGAR